MRLVLIYSQLNIDHSISRVITDAVGRGRHFTSRDFNFGAKTLAQSALATSPDSAVLNTHTSGFRELQLGFFWRN